MQIPPQEKNLVKQKIFETVKIRIETAYHCSNWNISKYEKNMYVSTQCIDRGGTKFMNTGGRFT